MSQTVVQHASAAPTAVRSMVTTTTGSGTSFTTSSAAHSMSMPQFPPTTTGTAGEETPTQTTSMHSDTSREQHKAAVVKRPTAFGSSANRFSMANIHPQNRTPGSYLQVSYLGDDDPSRLRAPGRYNIEKGGFALDAVEERAQGPGWFEQLETTQEAAVPRTAVADKWHKQKRLEEEMGPGKYPVSDFIDKEATRTYGKRDSVFKRTANRFGPQDRFRENLPGPGSYGAPKESMVEQLEKKCFSTRGLLSQGDPKTRSIGQTSRALTGNDKHDIPPNKYAIQRFPASHFPDHGPKRGYIDMSSEKKIGPIKTGHMAQPRRNKLGPGQYNYTSFTADLLDKHNVKKGAMSKLDRVPQPPTQRIELSYLPQVIPPSEQPGPPFYFRKPRSKSAPLSIAVDSLGDYYAEPGERAKHHRTVSNCAPFHSNTNRYDDVIAKRCFHSSPWETSVARDNINKFHESRHINGHTYVFNSAHEHIPPTGNAKDVLKRERLQTKKSTLTKRAPLLED
eukprot:scpid53763/ scgid28807/ Uncharacterized protein C1orf177 homolog